MRRLRWYQIQWRNIELDRIAKSMLKFEYSKSSATGFRLEKIRRNAIVGRYIEHRQVTDEIRDPFGDIATYTHDVYDIVPFHIKSNFPELELIDPPRRFSPFLTKLAEFTDFNISISSIDANLKHWIDAIGEEHKTIITGVTSAPYQLESGTLARFSIGGSQDIRKQINKFSSQDDIAWQKAKLRTFISDQNFEFDLTNRCSASFISKSNKELVNTLRKTLQIIAYSP